MHFHRDETRDTGFFEHIILLARSIADGRLSLSPLYFDILFILKYYKRAEMSTIITIVIFVVIFIAVVYYKQTKAIRRARRAIEWDNLLIYPAKQHDMYIIRDSVLKDIIAIAKDLDNGTREYVMFFDTDKDKVSNIIIDNKDEVINRCHVDENGNLYCYLKEQFEKHVGNTMKYNECHGNIKDHEWFHSKTGDAYRIREA